jgi:flagellar hook-associated protein 1 FlgK
MLTDQGEDVAGRVSGGSLGGLFQTRDTYMGDYLQQLNTLASSFIYEVNLAYSQGAGLEGYASVQGTYAVNDTTAILTDSGLAYGAKLSAGTYTLVSYDADGAATMETIAFDPETDSLEDVADDINAAFPGGEITATVTSEGTLDLVAASATTFSFGEDTTGLMAALGLNTFFSGSDASTIGLHETIASDASNIHAGAISDDGTVAAGNNDIAKAIASLSYTTVSLTQSNGSTTNQTLQDYLASMVVQVGTNVSTAATRYASAESLSSFLYDQQESVSGVNLDEELTLLTKYQQEYEAAAQIIQTTQSMIDTLLDMV